MKILCLADTHLTPPGSFESGSLFPKALKGLPRKDAEARYETMVQGIRGAYESCISYAEEDGPWDMVVHLGDVTGGWKCRGMTEPSVQATAHQCVEDLRQLAPTVRFCTGNHDLGYDHPSEKLGGINIEALRAAEVCFGPLYWTDEGNETRLLGVSSSLASYRGDDPALMEERDLQREFVGDTLASHRNNPWMLFGHDPMTPHSLGTVLAPHMERMKGFVFGDLHTPVVGGLVRGGLQLARMLPGEALQVLGQAHEKSHMVPSTAPLWWKGHGLSTIDLNEDKLSVQRTHLPIPEQTRELMKQMPATYPRSLAWMAGWMI